MPQLRLRLAPAPGRRHLSWTTLRASSIFTWLPLAISKASIHHIEESSAKVMKVRHRWKQPHKSNFPFLNSSTPLQMLFTQSVGRFPARPETCNLYPCLYSPFKYANFSGANLSKILKGKPRSEKETYDLLF